MENMTQETETLLKLKGILGATDEYILTPLPRELRDILISLKPGNSHLCYH